MLAVSCSAPCPKGLGPAPLAHLLPGAIFSVELEDLFDAVFRSFGSGTFDEAYRSARNAELVGPLPVASWTPAPPAGGASEATDGADGAADDANVARRSVRLKRPLQVAPWMRLIGNMPDHCESAEEWSLRGVKRGSSWVIDIRHKISGTPMSDCFLLITRYRATAVGSGRTQIDAEAELQWLQSTMLQSRIEAAVLDEYRRGFEASFLPLVAQTLGAGGAPAEQSPAELGGGATYCAGTEGDLPSMALSLREASPATPQSPSGGREIVSEYAADWHGIPVGARFELRVEVKSASDLGPPEYRLGDLTTRLFSGPQALLSAVYVEIQYGSRTLQTAPAETPNGETNVGYETERFLLAYREGLELQVCARDKRGLQSLFRGDPLIGERALCLDSSIKDGHPRWADVPLMRAGSNVGVVCLRYQLLPLSDGAVVAPVTPQAEAEDAGQAEDFQTPPGSDDDA